MAGHLLEDGRVVARAQLHPEFSSFHSGPVPSGVVPCFLKSIADGCGDVVYPYGQDPALCLEKGYPATAPVHLSAIPFAFKIAWPVASIGYVCAHLLVYDLFCLSYFVASCMDASLTLMCLECVLSAQATSATL